MAHLTKDHTQRERWICIYPAYVNSKKTAVQGRKIAKDKCVDNPTTHEIRDVCLAAGMMIGVENKLYNREQNREPRGRIRIQMRNEDGTPRLPQFATRKSIMYYIGESIPKLKTRQQKHGGSTDSGQDKSRKKYKKKR
ncbi:signal recognition particle 19 kDa protein-like [Anneissia japonica]|uniref:signal recognition particle 19 kDa protein-like n=1 Tax=Anneissia japonica TaxID=1529436 RepID=UPI001425B3BE|nr:signal recognition particle 19 kDa protein-like [Anneissia japonica]